MLDRLLTALLTLVLTFVVSSMGHVAFQCKGEGARHAKPCCPAHAPDDSTLAGSSRVERPRCCTAEHDEGLGLTALPADERPTELSQLAVLRHEDVLESPVWSIRSTSVTAARGPPRPSPRPHRVLFSSFLL